MLLPGCIVLGARASMQPAALGRGIAIGRIIDAAARFEDEEEFHAFVFPLALNIFHLLVVRCFRSVQRPSRTRPAFKLQGDDWYREAAISVVAVCSSSTSSSSSSIRKQTVCTV